MKKRIFWSILLTSFLVLVITAGVMLPAVYNEMAGERKAEIVTEAGYISAAYSGDVNYIEKIGYGSKNRITLVSPDGAVLYDSFADAASLPNHSDRPEIESALQNGSGEATRDSETLGEKTYYYAMSLSDGNILRVAATMKSIGRVFGGILIFIALAVIAALLLSVASARFLTRRIVRPINEIDLDGPLESKAYDELSPLLVRMDRQNKKIEEQLEELSEKQREFSEITDGMSEALVVFGTEKKVLSANSSAKKLFETDSLDGLGYLELCRDREYIEAAEKAFEGKPAGARLEKSGRIYGISVNPVGQGKKYAAVLFAQDVTESVRAEQMRREFSANVSHELKTPLTSIMGYAEIMQNGVAKKEDFPRFAGEIYSEAKRLLSLVEDIIRLSRLDEKAGMTEFKQVDLYKVAEEVVSELAQKAEKLEVELSAEGEHAVVKGMENILHEIIFNLCDNALVYNHKKGKAVINVRGGEHPTVKVSDTGIGIAAQERDRVFERFYRVDKSRSKETGGTGLGLSIVKHGAAANGAEVRLESEPGRGTEVSLIF